MMMTFKIYLVLTSSLHHKQKHSLSLSAEWLHTAVLHVHSKATVACCNALQAPNKIGTINEFFDYYCSEELRI
jgi:hypothetical protein